MNEYRIEPPQDPLTLQISAAVSTVFKGGFSRWEPLVLGLFGSLHVLIDDLPGVGKTTLAKALSQASGLDFGRIQFTPDLLPGDVLGMTVWSQEKKDFFFRPGGIMHQFLLADEINRSSSRTQSALLEAMQECQITVDGVTHPLPQPFMVVATQNPSSFQGTFPLPEAQIDRFGLTFSLGYPSAADGVEILDLHHSQGTFEPVNPVCTTEDLMKIRSKVSQIPCTQGLKNWIIKIAERTRVDQRITLGLSPRASQHWLQCARASAYIRGREFVIPEDLLHTALWALPHRLILSGQARLEGKKNSQVLESVLETTEIPLK